KIPLVLPLTALDREAGPIAGGKGANLGELVRIGLSVPAGFCVTTEAYELATGNSDLDAILAALAAAPAGQTDRLRDLAAAARNIVLALPVPAAVVCALTASFVGLCGGACVRVAVLSSSTSD